MKERPVPNELQDQFHELSSRQRVLVLRFVTAIHVLQTLYYHLTTDQAYTFLAVWAEEGLPVSVLARRCGIKPVTVSIHLRRLTSRVVGSKPGLDLLTVVDDRLSDLRLRHVFLTERGHRLASRMIEVMQDNPRKRIGPMGELFFEDEVQGSIWPEETSDASHS
jgi:DNA-binding MarR family transcriptional regulator